MHLFPKIILIVVLISCQADKLSVEECNQLARHTYKGLPKAAAKFKKSCQKMPLQWSPKRCEEVFQKIVLRTPKATLIESYGPEYTECLSENDLEKFGSYLLENK